MAVEEKSRTAGPIKRGVLKLNLVASYEQSFPSFYSNYAVVSNTPTELCIDFCVMAPPHKINVEKKTTSVPVVSRILMPAGMARALIKALESQLQKHEAARKSKTLALGRKEQ
jgi:hypothetical protein